MRILHISTRLILGGSQENTVLSCEGQARRGHEVHLAFGPIYGPEGSLLERVEKFGSIQAELRGGGVAAGGTPDPRGITLVAGGMPDPRGITTHVVPHLIREVNPIADRRCLRELESLIRELKPDVVHTHSSKAGVLGRVAAWGVRNGKSHMAHGTLGGIGIVHTIHGPPFMPVEGSALRRARVRLKNWVYTRAERHAARRCDVIVSVADAMTREFLQRGIGRPEQYVTVRSGMETGAFVHAAAGQTREDVRARLGLGPEDFVVGTVARLAEHKGHDDLLDALGDELKRSARLKLLWVGDGWWRERLIARARSMGLEVAELDRGEPGTGCRRGGGEPVARVLVTGLVPPDRIPGLIRGMDVLAHPSYREGLPRTVPQALLCGVCPVAYDCDGTGEVLREMETGRLVPVGDRARLREAIVWLMGHDAERRAMAERGRAECAEAFSAERMVEELEGVYTLALERARRA